ncbi:MAG: hypothetical protein WKF90_11040 [Pyrinomonadaceae bacterium]
MTETAFLTKGCVECLEVLKGNDFRDDFLENPVCLLCAESYYAPCAGCTRVVAVDEAVDFNSGADELVYRCPACKSSATDQAEVNFDVEEMADLVDEYVSLYTEEKRIKEQLEAIKEQLKAFAETRSDGEKKTVTLAGIEGKTSVKCTYRTSLKADTGKVAELKDCLGPELFSTLFSEKLSFDVNKSNFEKVISPDADLPEDVRRQIEDAVKISVSATLNVA